MAKQPCLVCGREPCDPHHLRFAQPRGLGQKVSDEFTVPLCRAHHRELHRAGKERDWWAKAGLSQSVWRASFGWKPIRSDDSAESGPSNSESLERRTMKNNHVTAAARVSNGKTKPVAGHARHDFAATDRSNRRNAMKSSGPKTQNGKPRSSQNAVRHGLTAETVIRPLEDPADYRDFEQAVTSAYDAETAVERELVLRLASEIREDYGILTPISRARQSRLGSFGSPTRHYSYAPEVAPPALLE